MKIFYFRYFAATYDPIIVDETVKKIRHSKTVSRVSNFIDIKISVALTIYLSLSR